QHAWLGGEGEASTTCSPGPDGKHVGTSLKAIHKEPRHLRAVSDLSGHQACTIQPRKRNHQHGRDLSRPVYCRGNERDPSQDTSVSADCESWTTFRQRYSVGINRSRFAAHQLLLPFVSCPRLHRSLRVFQDHRALIDTKKSDVVWLSHPFHCNAAACQMA